MPFLPTPDATNQLFHAAWSAPKSSWVIFLNADAQVFRIAGLVRAKPLIRNEIDFLESKRQILRTTSSSDKVPPRSKR